MLIGKKGGEAYELQSFENEQEIEDLVLKAENVQRLFGSSAAGLM